MKLSEFKSLIREEVKKVLSEYYAGGNDTIGKVMKSGDWSWISAKELSKRPFKQLNLVSKFAPIHAGLQKFANVKVQDFFTNKEYNELEEIQEQLMDAGYDAADLKSMFNDVYKIVATAIKRNQSGLSEAARVSQKTKDEVWATIKNTLNTDKRHMRNDALDVKDLLGFAGFSGDKIPLVRNIAHELVKDGILIPSKSKWGELRFKVNKGALK
jgi:hypothetical protein